MGDAKKHQTQSDQSNAWDGWNSNKKETQANTSKRPTVWEKHQTQSDQSNAWGGWNSNKKETKTSKSKRPTAEECPGFNSWNRTEVQKKKPIQSDQSTPSGGWKSNDAGNERVEDAKSQDVNCWNQPNDSSAKPHVWDKDKMHGQSNSVWGSQSPKGTHTKRSSDIGGWNEDRGQDELNQPTRSLVWSSSPIESSDDSSWKENRAHDWSNRPTKALGWGSSSVSDRRNQRNRSTQSLAPVGPDGQNANGILTATGRRLDLFTCEEEKILNDVEPISLSTKRILHNSIYNDGDRLLDEDQPWVLDNVSLHHPNKATKMGEKIDYVMVGKHDKYQVTSCFFVVSTNGFRVDFSYLKCLENYVKEKYPDGVDAFNQKYFKKCRSEGMNQQQTQ